jgi:hypothetical protein
MQELGGQMMLVTDGGGSKVVLAYSAHIEKFVTRNADGLLVPLTAKTSLGKLLCAIPAIIEAARFVSKVRPSNWKDDEDVEGVTAWTALDNAFAHAALDLPIEELPRILGVVGSDMSASTDRQIDLMAQGIARRVNERLSALDDLDLGPLEKATRAISILNAEIPEGWEYRKLVRINRAPQIVIIGYEPPEFAGIS